MTKPFKTTQEQLSILKDRGLTISFDTATNQLNNIGYFNLVNGFETLLLEPYTKNAIPCQKRYVNKKFDAFISLYNFDRCLSISLLENISNLEIKLKALIPKLFYQHKSTNNLDYLKENCYRTNNSLIFKKDLVRGKLNGVINKIKHSSRNWHNIDFQGYFETSLFKDNLNTEIKFKSRNTLPRNKKLVNFECQLETNYINIIRNKYDYISKFQYPPFWIAIKPLTFGQLVILVEDLDHIVLQKLAKEFGYSSNNKEAFVNALKIVSELRNHCAHFELVNRFRTSSKLEINPILIQLHHLNCKRSNYILKLFDVLKVLKTLTAINNSCEIISKYLLENKFKKMDYINLPLLTRMGNSAEEEWKNL